MTIFLLDVKEIWILSTDLHKISNIQFRKSPFSDKPFDTSGQTDRYDETNSRFSPIYERTQNDLHAPSHTFTHIPLSGITTDQAFRHVLPSVYQHSAPSKLQTTG